MSLAVAMLVACGGGEQQDPAAGQTAEAEPAVAVLTPDKKYSITEVPPERWSIDDFYDPDPSAPDKTYSKIGGWVRGFEFDWRRFRMPPKMAAAMDASQKWAVTIAAEALEDSLVFGADRELTQLEITALALDFGLLTAHTSLVAVDRTPRRFDEEQLVQSEIPGGTTFTVLIPVIAECYSDLHTT